MACIFVMMAILLGSLNTAVTGAGNTIPGSVASVRDEIQLTELFKGFLAIDGAAAPFPLPSRIDRSGTTTHDVTASLYSAAVMANAVAPKMLISGNERNPMVEMDEDYNFGIYSPADGTWWDPSFKADLANGSNASFAHMLLVGNRLEQHWLGPSLDGRFPFFGTRGPRDGVVSASSYTTGRDGTWAGHVCFGDGHVVWTDTTTAPGLVVGSGASARPDGLFSLEEGPLGGDAALVFMRLVGSTREMQFD